MGFHSVERVKTRLDAVLDKEGLDEDAVVAVCDALTPGADGTWPGVEVMLHVLERPLVAEALRDDAAPERLLQVASEAVRAVAPMVERSPRYPLAIQVDRLRRAYDRERRKYEMVRKKLAHCDKERGTKIAGAYLETSPATMFAERLGGEFEEVFQGAMASREAGRKAIAGAEQLAKLLRFDKPMEGEFAEELMRRIDDVSRRIDEVESAVRGAAAEGSSEEALVAGAIAVRRGLSSVAGSLLSRVVQAEPFAAQAAAFAGWLTPSSTRHVLGRFLVDVLNDGTPREEYGIDEQQLRRSIVAARTVLPLIGSPAEEIRQVDEEAEEVARTVRRSWAFCGASKM